LSKEKVMDEQNDLKQLGIVDILKTSAKLYRDNFALFLGIAVLVFAPILILSGVGAVQFSGFSVLLGFLVLIGGAIAAGGMSFAVCGIYTDKKLSFRGVLKRMNQPELLAILGTAFIVSGVVIGIELAGKGLMKSGIIGSLFLIPVVLLALWCVVNWSLFAQSVVIEKHGVIESLRRSKELVKQNWWRVCGLIIMLAMFILIPLWIARAIGEGITNVPAVGQVLSVLAILFTVPVYIIGTTLLYFSLRIKKEGFTKEKLVQEMSFVEGKVKVATIDENYMRKRNALYIVLGANLLLILLKFILARISGSVAIAASGWMSVENFFLTGAVMFGLMISVRDKRISKKLSVIENVLAIMISAAILYIAGNMFIKMFLKMSHGMEGMAGHGGMSAGGLMYVPAVTVAAIFGAGICYFMSQYKIYIGKSCGSSSIEAAGRHCRLHVVMEVAVIIGLIGSWIGLAKLNLLAAAFVLAYVIYTGFAILWKGYKGLTAGYPMEHACHIERNYRIIGSFIGVMLVLYFASGIYTIKWNENGVVKQFGRDVGIVQPGLRYHLPWPIESVEKVSMEEVRDLETESLLQVAGDENIVKVKIGVHYNVKDPSDYVFNVQDQRQLVLFNAETAIRDIVGRLKIIGEEDGAHYLLTNGKSEVEDIATKSLQALLDKDDSGIRVLSVQILTLEPPDEVAEAFRDIASAMEEKQTYILEAEEYRNQIVTEAKGQAAAMVILAEGYRIKKINNARGESEAYIKKLSEYQKARKITDMRLYLETMEKVLPGVKKVFVDENINKETTDLWLFNDKVKGKVIGLE
jgi:membrane protease subunit HflK